LTTQSNAVVAACQDAGFTPHLGPAVPHISSRLNLVAAGLGIAVVASSLQRMNIEGVVYRRLKGAARLKVPLNLATRRGDNSAAVRQFLKLAKQVAASFRG
jgi:DNA-binding transcriptional LysR family regulator